MIGNQAELQAHALRVSAGLTDVERLALGITLVDSIHDHRAHGMVRAAARMLDEKAKDLAVDALRHADAPALPDRTPIHGCIKVAPTRPRAQRSPRRDRLRRIWAAVEDGPVGDAIGAVCLMATLILLTLFTGVLT